MLFTQSRSLHFLIRLTRLLLLLSLSAIFLYSAYSKLFAGFDFHKSFFSAKDNFFVYAFTLDYDAFDRFRWTFLDLGINNMFLAGFAARMAIALELAIGLMLLFQLHLRKFTLPLTIALLSVFIVYLLYVLAVHGNTGDCGCFGNKIGMTPLMAIWKNILMISASGLLIFLYKDKNFTNTKTWLPVIIGMVAISLPLIVTPLSDDILPVTTVNETIDLDPLYNVSPSPAIDLRKGKYILAFMSLTCHHCQKAAYLLQTIHHQNPAIPMYFVLAGHPDQEEEFFKKSGSKDIPHILFTNSVLFANFTRHPQSEKHSGVPAIYWINNSIIERKSSYYQLDPKEINAWIKQ